MKQINIMTHPIRGELKFVMNQLVQKRPRNSSLELLRIISMLVIVGYHYSVHGGYNAFSDYPLDFGIVFIQLLGLFGKVSCSVFALISGYFLINAGKKYHYRRIIPLVAQTHFYYFIIWVIMLLTKLVSVSLKDTIKSFFPIFFGTWYIVYYIVLYLLVPVINPWLKAMSKGQYIKFLILLMFIWSVVPTFTSNAWEFSDLDFFLVMYITGAFIRLHVKNSYSNRWNLLLGGSFIFLMILSVLAFDIVGKIAGMDLFIDKATYFCKYNSVLAVGCAIFIFMYFANLSFYNKTINKIASTTLGIYLIHNNFYVSDWFWTVFYSNADYIQFPYLHATVKIWGIFIVCMMIDYVRGETIGKWFNKWLDQHYDNIVLRIKKWGAKGIYNGR